MDFFIYFVDRGYDFRPDYGKLDILASLFPSKSFIALTATAPVAYQNAIIEHFAMQNPLRVLENPNRSNIFYEINQRPAAVKENNEDQFEKLINKLGSELKELRIKFPLTILLFTLLFTYAVLVTIYLNSNLVISSIFLLDVCIYPVTDYLLNFIHLKAKI